MRPFPIPLLFILTVLLGSGCARAPETAADLTPSEARAWLAQTPGAQLVDVRTKEEYAQGHLAGSRLIPVQELESRTGELDKEKPVLLYCRSGKRSRQAFELLKTRGFKDLHDMTGGITAWMEQGLPVEVPLKNGVK